MAGVAAAAIGLGVSAAARADTPTPTPTSTTSSTPSTPTSPSAPSTGQGHGWGQGGRHLLGGLGGLGRGALGKQALSGLATKLGVDEAKLKDALVAVRAELRADRQAAQGGSATGDAAKPDRSARQDELASKLAAKLGISADKVKTAFAELRSAARTERETAFANRLDQAVKDGTLTRAEADAVRKAAQAGVIRMAPGRG